MVLQRKLRGLAAIAGLTTLLLSGCGGGGGGGAAGPGYTVTVTVSGLAGSGLLIVLKFIVQPDTWLLLGLCTTAGGLLYLGVLLRFGLNGSEYADLRRMWNRLQSIAFGIARTAPV